MECEEKEASRKDSDDQLPKITEGGLETAISINEDLVYMGIDLCQDELGPEIGIRGGRNQNAEIPMIRKLAKWRFRKKGSTSDE